MIHASELLGSAPAIWLCETSGRIIRDQEVHVMSMTSTSGVIACDQYYRIGGSTYVGAGTGATL